MSPRLPFQPQQHPQTVTQLNTSSAPFSSTPILAAKNSVFSNALSSPVRRSLQHYHSVQVGYHSNNVLSSANGSRNTETNYCHQQIRELNSPSPNDCMDMHADSPARDFLWISLWQFIYLFIFSFSILVRLETEITWAQWSSIFLHHYYFWYNRRLTYWSSQCLCIIR